MEEEEIKEPSLNKFNDNSKDDLAFSYFYMGMLKYKNNDYENALNYFNKSLDLSVDLYQNLLKDTSTTEDKLSEIKQQILNLKQIIFEVSNILGDLQLNKNAFEDAFKYFQNGLCYEINDPIFYCKIGKCLQELGASASAAKLLENVVKFDSSDNEINRLIGDLYYKDYAESRDGQVNKSNLKKIIKYYTQYVELAKPTKLLAGVYNRMGHLYETLNQYTTLKEQVECFEKAIAIFPNFRHALKNLAIVYPRVGRDKDSVKCYHKIIKMGEATMNDYFDYAAIQIKLGNFLEGWKYYEYRFQKETGSTVYPKIDKPRWNGQDIGDKTLLVQWEQGFGDSLFLFRFMELIKPFAKKIILRVQEPLLELFKLNANGYEVVGKSTDVESLSFDYHVPMMSIIHLLKLEIKDIPYADGYLKVDETKAKRFDEEFFNNDCLKIGISWHGAATGNFRRNIPLESFYPLAKLKNVKLYSFQKYDGTEELKNVPKDIEIIDLGKTFNNFSDTAAAMKNIDLFITGDNALLNLAGALGKKTFLLLNQDAEWRWLLDENKTPWFSSVKLFKKKVETDSWSLLIDRVIDEIENNIK